IPVLDENETPDETPVLDDLSSLDGLSDLGDLNLDDLNLEDISLDDVPSIDSIEPDVENNSSMPDLGEVADMDLDAATDIENNSSMPDLGELSDIDLGSLEGLDDTPAEETVEEQSEESLEDEDISNLLKELEGMSEEVEAAGNISADPIDEFLNLNTDAESSGLENESLESLLADSDDMDLSEIGDILDKEENDILLDEGMGLEAEEDFTSGNMSEEELFDLEDVISDDGGKKKKKKKKKDKKSSDEIEEDGEKKPGFIARIIAFLNSLTKEPGEEEGLDVFAEESATDLALEGAIENDIALKELEEEDSEANSKGKKKKEKKKKEPDPKAKEKAAAKAAAKAAKKAAKEAKKAEEAKIPTKKLPKKKVIPIYILCFSLGVAITLLAYIVPSKLDKKKAFESYQNGNYEETYALLKGNKLNEKEQLTYDRAVVLLKAQRKLDSYNNYISLGMRTEALNALVQGAKEAAELRENAETLGVVNQFDDIYRRIIAELKTSFGVSEDKVNQWIQIDNIEDYTLTLNRYLNRAETGDTVDSGTEDQIISGEESEIDIDVDVAPVIENAPDDGADYDEVIAAEEAEF
ncbi:MAG: hypothetical protein Q4E51_09815, partial [Lachnospiraceae bacterium]|nr:hypothetical protein [Lachnospiraceae bacterium]